MVVCFSFLMFACGPSDLVDTSGNYKAMTEADVEKLESCAENWEKQQVVSMEFKFSMSYTLSNGDYAEMTTSGFVDSTGNMSFEAHVIENTDGAKTETKVAEAYIDMSTELVYMNNKTKKVCERLDGSYYEMLPNMLNFEMVNNFLQTTTEIEIAEKGGYTKFKTVADDVTAEAYLVFDSNYNFYGLSTSSTANLGNGTQSVEFELKVSNKAVELPSDLDSYIKVFA